MIKIASLFGRRCVGCRTAKAACAGFSDQELHSIPDEETTDAVVLIGRRCNRCQRIGLVTCEFMPSRRKGRPRRLLPKTEDSETATASPDFTAATNSDSASPAESSRCNSSPQDLSIPLPRDTTHDSLAQAYLTQIHPFLPLLPSSSLEETSAYFARAGPHLHRSIHLLLKPRSMTFDQLPPLSIYQDTLDDLQAAVFSAFLAYGALGAKEVAKGRLRWACEKVKQSGWTGEEGDEGDGGSFQRLAWVCWGAEIQLGVLTGSRDRILGFVQPPATVRTEQHSERSCEVVTNTQTDIICLSLSSQQRTRCITKRWPYFTSQPNLPLSTVQKLSLEPKASSTLLIQSTPKH